MTPLEWVGAIVAVLICLAGVLAAIGYLLDIASKQWDRIVWRAAERFIRERGQHMRSQLYWWEQPEQAAVWLACAEHMHDGSYPDVSTVRDQTYKRCLEEVKARRSW